MTLAEWNTLFNNSRVPYDVAHEKRAGFTEAEGSEAAGTLLKAIKEHLTINGNGGLYSKPANMVEASLLMDLDCVQSKGNLPTQASHMSGYPFATINVIASSTGWEDNPDYDNSPPAVGGDDYQDGDLNSYKYRVWISCSVSLNKKYNYDVKVPLTVRIKSVAGDTTGTEYSTRYFTITVPAGSTTVSAFSELMYSNADGFGTAGTKTVVLEAIVDHQNSGGSFVMNYPQFVDDSFTTAPTNDIITGETGGLTATKDISFTAVDNNTYSVARTFFRPSGIGCSGFLAGTKFYYNLSDNKYYTTADLTTLVNQPTTSYYTNANVYDTVTANAGPYDKYVFTSGVASLKEDVICGNVTP